MNCTFPLRRRGLLADLGATGLSAGATAPAGAQSMPRLPLTASTTEGPYYFDAGRVRSDITEGLPGVPLELRFAVLDEAARPLPALRVDVWHCDAQGRYSGYRGQGDDRRRSTEGETFLRGSQPTDREGLAMFRTIYPGWYAGRTTHVHLKVLDGARAVLTSQCFLPDALSEFLYTQLPPYRRARLRDTLNRGDGIAVEAGGSVVGAVREEHDRYVATLRLVVDPSAAPALDRPTGPPDDRRRGPAGSRRPDEPPSWTGGHGDAPPRGAREPLPEGEARAAALVPGPMTR